MTISVDAITTKDENSYYGPTPFLPKTISHPGGTGLGGVLVYINYAQSTVENVVTLTPELFTHFTVTYGGVTVPLVVGPYSMSVGPYNPPVAFRTFVFMLSGIPDGTQNVTVDAVETGSNNVNARPSMVIITFNSDNGGIALDASTTVGYNFAENYGNVPANSSDWITDPSATLTCSAQAFLSANLASGWFSPENLQGGPQAGCTDIFIDDWGIRLSATLRRTNIEVAGTYTMGWITSDPIYGGTSNECAVLATAIIEAGTPEPDGVWAWVE